MHIVLYGIVGAALLALLAVVVVFARWRGRVLHQLLSGGTIVQTLRGPIHCAFTGPDGARPVLVLHGGLGGWDQAMALAGS